MTDTLTSHIRGDGTGVIRDEENPDAWIVFEEDVVMEDPALESQSRTTTSVEDWTPGRPDSHPGPQTDVDDWELKD